MNYIDFLESDLITEAFDHPLPLKHDHALTSMLSMGAHHSFDDLKVFQSSEKDHEHLFFMEGKRNGRYEYHFSNMNNPMHVGPFEKTDPKTAFSTSRVYSTVYHMMKNRMDQGEKLRITGPEKLLPMYLRIAEHINKRHFAGSAVISKGPDTPAASIMDPTRSYPSYHIDPPAKI